MSNLPELLKTMAALRDKETGCSWDIKQTFETIAPYTIEEAYEVADAISRKNMKDLQEELGDLLLQVVFHSQIASEMGLFTFEDVAKGLNDKLIRRHPHVFGEKQDLTPEQTKVLWAQIKREEKGDKTVSLFSNITGGLPPLKQALEIQKVLTHHGFDWENVDGIFDKLQEEIEELRFEVKAGDKEKQAAELGDLFFVLVNLARFLNHDSDMALSATNVKVIQRFKTMENELLKLGYTLDNASLEQMEEAWVKAKLNEKL